MNNTVKTISDTTGDKDISVVVATRNRPQDVRHLLDALLVCDNGSILEVILVDDASGVALEVPDGPWPFEVVLIRNEVQRGAAASRNTAGQAARGRILAFMDDDARPLPDWCDVLSQELTEDRAAITGRVLPFDGGTVSRARQHRYDLRYREHGAFTAVRFFAGGNSAIWTDRFLAVGGFPDVVTASDNGLVERVESEGGNVFFVPALRVAHRNSKGARIAFREAWRSGRLAERARPTASWRQFRSAVSKQPWSADRAVAGLNTALQAAHSLARALPVL